MAKDLQSRVVITADDRTGSAFNSVASKLKALAATATQVKTVTAQVNAMKSALAGKSAADQIGIYRQAARQTLELSRAHQQALAQFRGTAAQMNQIGPQTQALVSKYNALKDAVRESGRALSDQKAVMGTARSALRDAGIDVTRLTSEQRRLAAATEAAHRAQQRQARWQRRREEAGPLLFGAGLATGHAVKQGAKASLHTYREFDDERRFMKAVLGLSDAEIRPLVDQAIHGGATSKFNDIQYLHAQRDLAARGVKRDAIMGMIPAAATFGMAAGQTLPEAVKLMEAGIFMFKKPTDSVGSASASAKQTADVMTMAMKISGMTPEDVGQAYKYGATGARMAGVSEQSLLSFAGVLKKAGIGGDEAGVAFRALMGTIQSPTRGARTALLANGLDYSKYQRAPDQLAMAPFVKDIAAQYGVRLDGKAQAALAKVFSDRALISDAAKFAPAVMDVLSEHLGGDDAKSKKSIAGAANRYRASSMQGVDANAFMTDMLSKMRDNLQFANALFGQKQGSRIATALGDPETFQKMREMLMGKSEGYAQKIADERMSGFDGAVSRFEGAIKNLETAIGRAWDADGEGKGGILTSLATKAAEATQALAELSPNAMKVSSALVGFAGGAAGLYSAYNIMRLLMTGGGLTASAVALDGSAAALTAAAARLGVAGAAGAAAGLPAAGAAGTAAAAGAGAMSLLSRVGLAGIITGGAYAIWTIGQANAEKYKDVAPGEVHNEGMKRKQRANDLYRERMEEFKRDNKVELEGSAEIKSKVEVSLEPGLKAKLEQAISAAGHLKSGGSTGVGSTGRTMPEASGDGLNY